MTIETPNDVHESRAAADAAYARAATAEGFGDHEAEALAWEDAARANEKEAAAWAGINDTRRAAAEREAVLNRRRSQEAASSEPRNYERHLRSAGRHFLPPSRS